MNELTTYKSFFQSIIATINSTKYKAYKFVNKFHIEQNFKLEKLSFKIRIKITGENLLLIHYQKTLTK